MERRAGALEVNQKDVTRGARRVVALQHGQVIKRPVWGLIRHNSFVSVVFACAIVEAMTYEPQI